MTNTPAGALSPNNGVTNSIYTVVNSLIAQYSLATAGTNYLALVIGSYGTNCALIYPGWASNFVVQTSVGVSPPLWTPLNAGSTTISNCNVVFLTGANTCAFFRLSQ